MRLFVSCSSGLEGLLEEEIRSLGFDDIRHGFRGVHVEVDHFSAVYAINYASRLASRVLCPLAHFKVSDAKSLYIAALKLDWSQYMDLRKTFSIDFSVDHPAFKNTLFAAQVVKDALCDQFREKTGERPSVDTYNPQVQFHLFIREGKGTLSLDTSLTPLHKRGYRTEGGEAPLQETLAAALLKIAKYTPEDILVDPCMGSGTFLIEAALMASNTPPGLFRQKWGFESHPDYSKNDWLDTKKIFDSRVVPLKPNHFFGYDINRNMVRIAITNVRAAGMHQWVKCSYGDFRTLQLPTPATLIIANPPYGKRLSEVDQLVPLYRALGDFMKQEAKPPARGFVLTAEPDLAKAIGLKTAKRHVVFQGGLEARFLEFDLY